MRNDPNLASRTFHASNPRRRTNNALLNVREKLFVASPRTAIAEVDSQHRDCCGDVRSAPLADDEDLSLCGGSRRSWPTRSNPRRAELDLKTIRSVENGPIGSRRLPIGNGRACERANEQTHKQTNQQTATKRLSPALWSPPVSSPPTRKESVRAHLRFDLADFPRDFRLVLCATRAFAIGSAFGFATGFSEPVSGGVAGTKR